MSIDIEKERALFEAWASTCWDICCAPEEALRRRNDGKYCDIDVQRSWAAWLARASLPATPDSAKPHPPIKQSEE